MTTDEFGVAAAGRAAKREPMHLMMKGDEINDGLMCSERENVDAMT